MPIAPTYPGVYVEELPSGVHTITGVSTAVTAFVGFFGQGPMNTPVQIFSVSDLERNFGPLRIDSEAGYGIRQFFANGGAEAWVVRVAAANPGVTNLPANAAIEILDAVKSGTAVLIATAFSEGNWGNSLRLTVDYNTAVPGTGFNLTVTQVDNSSPPNIVATELYRNLVMDPAQPSNYALSVVNAASSLIQLSLPDPTNPPAGTARPAATGTLSGDVSAVNLTTLADKQMDVFLNGSNTATATLTYPSPPAGSSAPTSLTDVAGTLQTLLQAITTSTGSPALPNVKVSLIPEASGKAGLQISTFSSTPGDVLTFGAISSTQAPGDDLSKILSLDSPSGFANVQQYALGADKVADTAQEAPNSTVAAGADGGQPDATGIIGDPTAKTGMYALENAPGFNILCLADVMNRPDNEAATVITAAVGYCQQKYAFLIVDVPQNPSGGVDVPALRESVTGIQTWLAANNNLRSNYAALYYPRPQIPDPLNGFRLRPVASSGTLAGLYAQTDGTRGVWKAPAGTATALANVSALSYVLNDPENGVLNPLAINCLRSMPVYGNVCWGARTLQGADVLESQWKYIPVRRLANYIEASLYQGLQWVVFEPNAEPLWSQIRLNVGTFMQQLFSQGAFQGSTPNTAYFVKCDHDSTTQADINLGVVNIIVGFAPLLPAEFVILQIQQIAGQSPT